MGYFESLKQAVDYTVIRKAARLAIFETIASLVAIGLPSFLTFRFSDYKLWPFLLLLVLQVVLILSVIRLNVMRLPRKSDLVNYGWLFMAVSIIPGLLIAVLNLLINYSDERELVACASVVWIPISTLLTGYGVSRIFSHFRFLSSPETVPDSDSLLRLKTLREYVKKADPSKNPEIVEIMTNSAKYRLKPIRKNLVIFRFDFENVDSGLYIVPSEKFHLEAYTSTFKTVYLPVRFSWQSEDGRSTMKRRGTMTSQNFDKLEMWNKELFTDRNEMEDDTDEVLEDEEADV